MKYLLLFAGLYLFTGCTPAAAPQDSMARVNQEFKGQDVSNFFVSYGSPESVTSSTRYGKTYRWVSLEPDLGDDSDYLAHTGNYVIPDISSQGLMTKGYCEVSIRVNARERIEKITLINDSIGKFSGSRCAEIFSQSPN